MHRLFLPILLLILLSGCSSPATVVPTTMPTIAATDTPAPTATREPTIAPTATDVPPSPTPDRDAKWREDVETLVAGIERAHPNPYWRISEDDFHAMAAALEADIPTLTDQQIFFELMHMTAQIDGHSYLSMEQDIVEFSIYPLRLYPFDDGIFVIDAQEPHRDMIGAQVISIGGRDAWEVMEAAAAYGPHDNEYTSLLIGPWFMLYPDLLMHLGIIDNAANPEIVLEMPDGATLALNPEPIAGSAYGGGWVNEYASPMGLTVDDEIMSYEMLPGQVLYIDYRSVTDNTSQFASEIAEVLAAGGISKVVLDLRQNNGGEADAYQSLLQVLVENAEANPDQRFFVLIGRQTFSAGVMLAAELEAESHPYFIGEETGGSPSMYGDVVPVRLSNSKLTAYVSSRFYEIAFHAGSGSYIAPNLEAPPSSEDYFGGRDPALEMVFELTP